MVSAAMSDVFISYSREDRPRAEALAHVLEAQGLSVWWDRELPLGQSFSQVIATELERARAVLVLWSPASAASNWVKDEAQAAVDRGTLIPVLIEAVKIPYGFGQYQAADLTDWDETASDAAFVHLLAEIARVIKAPPVVPRRTVLEAIRGAYRRRRGVLVGGAVALGLVGGYVAVTSDLASLFGRSESRGGGARAARSEAVALTVRGLGEAAQSNYAGAILLYGEAVRAYATYPDAYFHRGQAFAILKQSPRAVTDFKQFLTLATGNAPERADAQEYLRNLEATTVAPAPTPTAIPRAIRPPAVPPAVKSLVVDMFAEDKTTRIRATTKLVVEHKGAAAVVPLAVAEARRQPGNKAGVINTLVLLEGIDPAVLRQHREGIEALLAAVADNGPMTAEHAVKVRRLLAA
jgi:hypothetical protein